MRGRKKQFQDTAKKSEWTSEQMSDTFTEGTIDGSIDRIREDGKLTSHEGASLQRTRKEK